MRFTSPLRCVVLGAVLLLFLVSCSRPPVETAAIPRPPAPAAAPFVLATELEQRLASHALHERLSENPALATRAATVDAAQLARPFQAFSEWLRDFTAADDAGRAALLATGRHHATARRAALKTLITIDPELALQLTLPDDLRRELPDELRSLLEQPIAAFGDLEVDVACGLPEFPDAHGHAAHAHTITRTLRIGDTPFEAFTYGQRLAVSTKRGLPVHGIAIDGLLALHESAVQRLPSPPQQPIAYRIGSRVDYVATEEEFADLIAAQEAWEATPGPDGNTAESPWTEGAKTMLYIRATFSDSPTAAPLELAQADNNQQSVDTFYRDNSYDQTSLATTFTPLVVLPNDEAYYNGQSWLVLLEDARAAAAALDPQYNSANYTFHTVATKKMASMTWAGRAAIGGAYSHLNGDFSLRVAAHEFGHNFGLYHANYNYTAGESPTSLEAYASAPSNSPMQEYGHRYTMMGASGTSLAHHFTAREKFLMDWMPASDAPTALASGTYRIFRHDHRDASSGLRTLKIPTGEATRAHFWLSHRKQFLPSVNNFSAGAEVLWGRPTNVSGGTLLIDMTPFSNDGNHFDSSSGDNNDKTDAALTEGRMFGSADAGAWFTITGLGGSAPAEYLDVEVNVGNFSTNRPPTVSLDQATATRALNQPLTLTATASDPDGDTVYYSWEFGDNTVGGNLAEQTKSWSTTGYYVVRVIAVDNKGGTASARCVVQVGTPSTFTAVGRVLADGQPVEGVRVFNGLTGSNYRGTRTDSDGYFTLPNLASGTYTLQARKTGYVFAPAFTNPVSISGHTADLNFTATTSPAPYVIVDNTDPTGVELTGSWTSLNSAYGFHASDYLSDSNTGKGTKQITFRPTLPGAGLYRVYMRYTHSSNRATNVPVDIVHEGGTNTFTVDQKANGGLWNYLGTFSFAAGTSGYARIRNDDTNGHVAADSFKFEATTTNDPTVRLVGLQSVARERGAVPAVVRIEREGPLDFPLTVYLGTENSGEGSATPGMDFAPLPSHVTIPADADHYDLTITPLPDSFVEGDELLTLSLRLPPEPTQEWEFNDASGTALAATRNSIEGGANWSDSFDATTTTGGVLRIKRPASGPTSSWAMLPNPNATATQHLVFETAGWTYAGTSPNEVVRFGFTTGANTTVTAQALISRTADGVTLSGDALGSGGTAIAPVQITTSINTTQPYIFVLTVDPVAKTYRIAYRPGDAGDFISIGSGTIAPDRALAAIRLSLANSFASSSSEKFDIARIALTEADPTQPAYVVAAPSSVEITLKDDPRDDWRLRHFSTEQIANGVLTAWDADPDADGLTNLQEYAFNCHPLQPDAASLLSPSSLPHEGKTYLSLSFERRSDDDGLTYAVEGSGELTPAAWPDTAVLHSPPTASATDGYEHVTYRDTLSLDDAARRFLRVRIQLDQ